MERRPLALFGVAALTLGVFACTSAKAPLSPSPTTSTAADGSTLKVTAPAPQSPVSDQRLSSAPTLVAAAAASTTGVAVPLQYRFEVMGPTGALVQRSDLLSSPSWAVTGTLAGLARHTWHVRAEYAGEAGPWSSAASFIAAEP